MKDRKQNPNLRVIPVRSVVHKSFSDLVGIRGHANYYVNLLSGKITFRSRGRKIPTGKTSIMEAKSYVEVFLRSEAEGVTEKQASRDAKGQINPTIASIWDDLIASKSAESEPSTIENYQTNWRNGLSGFWGKKHVGDINDLNVIAFKQWYLVNKPQRYFGHTLCHFKVLLSYAMTYGYLKKMPDLSPLRNVDEVTAKRKKKEWGKASKVFTEDEILKLLAAAARIKRPDKAARATLGILLGSRCGLRKMEAMGLRWSENGTESWVDLKNSVLHVWSKKNFKWREIALTDEVAAGFREQFKFTGANAYVFSRFLDPNKFISSQIFDKVWTGCKKAAGVSGRYHDLRHTFATRTAEAGWPPVIACAVLDQSLKIYQQVYCHPSSDSKAEWMRKTFEKAPENGNGE